MFQPLHLGLVEDDALAHVVILFLLREDAAQHEARRRRGRVHVSFRRRARRQRDLERRAKALHEARGRPSVSQFLRVGAEVRERDRRRRRVARNRVGVADVRVAEALDGPCSYLRPRLALLD